MLWNDVKKTYPNQWVLIEAIEAHTEGDKRVLDNIAVVGTFGDDNNSAMLEYIKLHRKHKDKELFVVHTSRPELDIIEQRWTGVRANL